MFKYADGTEVLIGDTVLIEHGKTSGVVHLIVNTAAEVKDFKVAEVGIMLKDTPTGFVYLTTKWLKEDPIAFVSRGKRKPLFKQSK
jgi:hypothetical protein